MKTPAGQLRDNGKRSTFQSIEPGTTFECNGNIWTKKSSRTAIGIWPACLPEWAYFGKDEIVYS